MNRIILFLLLLFPGLVMSQTYPEHPNVFVNDYAELLSEQSKKVLIEQLKLLKSETGIEATILTIDSRKSYGHGGSEQFATDLFNAWGIGDADQNNGILILIERKERAMRIELGEGFGRDYDLVASDVIDQSFVPSFRKDNYDLGIVRGTKDVLLRIARPFAAGKPAPEREADDSPNGNFVFMIALLGSFVFGFRKLIGDQFIRLKSCPNCGKRCLRRNRVLQRRATANREGERWSITSCSECDFRDRKVYSITYSSPSPSSSSSGGSFGGGSSSGGGASGSW